MPSIAELEILLRARDEASKVLRAAEANTRGFSASVERFAKPAFIGLTAAAAAFVGVAGLLVRAAMDDEVAATRLETAIKNTGIAFDDVRQGQVQTFINSLAEMSAFSKDEVREALTILVLGAGDLDEGMKRARIAVDLARGANIKFDEAARVLSKALEGDVEVLKKYGIHLDQGATAAEAADAVLRKYGKSAVAYAQDTRGEWEKLQNRFKEFAKEVGKSFLPIVDELLDDAAAMSMEFAKVSKEIAEWVRHNPELVKFGAATLAASAGLSGIVAAAKVLAPGLAILTGPAGAVVLVGIALQQVVETAVLVVTKWDLLVEHFRSTGAFEIPFIGGLLRALDLVITKMREIGAITGPSITPQYSPASGTYPYPTQDPVTAPAGGFTVTSTVPSSIVPGTSIRVGGQIPVGYQYDFASATDAYFRNAAGDRIRRALIPGGGGGGGGDFAALAHGGIVDRPTLALIGESGPEAVIPLSRRVASAPNIVVNVNVGGSVVGVEDLREQMVAAVRDAVLGGAFRGVLRA